MAKRVRLADRGRSQERFLGRKRQYYSLLSDIRGTVAGGESLGGSSITPEEAEYLGISDAEMEDFNRFTELSGKIRAENFSSEAIQKGFFDATGTEYEPLIDEVHDKYKDITRNLRARLKASQSVAANTGTPLFNLSIKY